MRLPILRRDNSAHNSLMAKASREAESGRRLAIFDRQTGLYAYWYLVRRFEEEARRAERYSRPLTALMVEVIRDKSYEVRDGLTAYLAQELRASDLASHLGDGRFLILLTETSPADGAAIAARMSARFSNALTVGLGSFPEDGGLFDEVKAAAERRSHCNWALAV